MVWGAQGTWFFKPPQSRKGASKMARWGRALAAKLDDQSSIESQSCPLIPHVFQWCTHMHRHTHKTHICAHSFHSSLYLAFSYKSYSAGHCREEQNNEIIRTWSWQRSISKPNHLSCSPLMHLQNYRFVKFCDCNLGHCARRLDVILTDCTQKWSICEPLHQSTKGQIGLEKPK